MERDDNQAMVFTRRALVVGALQGAAFMILGGRLGWLQIAQGQRYKTMADNNRINIKMLSPSRGYIVDRFENPLAVNGQNFRVLIVPEQTSDIAEALSKLQKLIPLTQHDIQRVIKQAARNPSFIPLEVKDNLDWEEVARIEVNLPDLPGLSIDEGEIRTYPQGNAAAHIIGYVGAVSKAEQTGDPLLNLPGFKVGKTGIEKTYDASLRGKAGAAEVEVNVVGREVRELRRNPGTPGARVRLTIDGVLQDYVQERLAAERSASAVVMDVNTGAIYALASSPAFDPNDFSRGLSAEKWEEMLADPGLPLNNKAVAGQYPPGSTFKMVTALSALENGVITKHTKAFCPGHYEYGDSRFHCWKAPGHGSVDLIQALAQSCDVFFYKLAVELGVDRLAVTAEKLGLGKRLDFELKEETPGLIPTRDWKKKQLGESWQPGESIVTSIGQGYNLTTPLQLTVMTARLVNGGYAVKPWVVSHVGDQYTHKAPVWPHIGFKPENMALILQGMDNVVNGANGTARGARISEEGFEMGGKTGTAQVKRITKQERAAGVANEDLAWHFRHHALFVGYAPLNNPRYACCVVVDHGGGGSAVAAPIARDILLAAQKNNVAAQMGPPAFDKQTDTKKQG